MEWLLLRQKLTGLIPASIKLDMKGCINIVFGFFFFLSVGILRGQTISYKRYTPQDGLPQSQVTCLLQDSRGYIWVGTKGGISCFNGTMFQNIRPKDGLPAAHISQIQEDPKGNIWFTCGKWFCKYDGKKISYDTTTMRPHDGQFCVDKSGTAWCTDAKSRLFQSNDFKNWVCISDKDKNLNNRKIHNVSYDKQADRLVLREDMGNGVGVSHTYREGVLSYLPHINWFNHRSSTHLDKTYAFSNDSIFEVKNDVISLVSKVKNCSISGAIRRPNGKIWFIQSRKDGIYCLHQNHQVDFIFLNTSSINFIFEDKDKNVWLGTEEGLVRLYLEGFKNFKKEDFGSVWSMVEDTEGAMWFGDYYTHQLRRYDGQKIVEKTIDYALVGPLKKGDFGEFYFGGDRDKRGNLYFPMGHGITKYDGKRFSPLSNWQRDIHQLSMNFYLDTIRDIIVSATQQGFNIIQLQTGVSKFYGQEKGVYCPGYMLAATKDKKGRYWLTAGSGISVFDVASDSVIQTYTAPNKRFPYFGSCTIFSDSKGTIWAGSAKGLLRYDEKGDSFALVAKNIIQSEIHALKQYKDQYLVVGASDGVYFLDLNAFYTEGTSDVRNPTSIVIKCFNQHNGYLGIEPNQNCLYIDSKDNVWVAASDIVTKIIPSELDIVQKPLMPYITTINNESIPYESYQKTIFLPSSVNTAKIFFEAVGFERPFNTEFSYKLDNAEWSEWRTEDFAVLDNLSSGIYTFSVRTCPAGTANEGDIKETYIRFKVNISIFREAYFPFLAFLVLSILGFSAWYYIQRQEEREKEVKKQHLIDIDQRKTVELLNTEMSHRVRNNLGMIQYIMSMQARRVKHEEAKKVLKESVDRIQAMSILHDYLIEKNGVETLPMKNYIDNLAESVRKSYSDDAKNLTFKIDIKDVELAETFGRHIGLIVSELLTNSIKHAFSTQEKPHVVVHLSETPTSVLLIYQDNGSGISPTFDKGQTNSLGLKLIYGIADRFKGKVTFDNREGLDCHINFEKKN